MIEYVDVEAAMQQPGLRVVLTPSLPAPWSESAKAILQVKNLPYVAARQDILGANPALVRWTAQTSAPTVAWNDEPPRCGWIDQLYLFERLAPQPPLIPADFDDRVLMFGLAHEICGENGYTWNRRHIMVRDHITPDQDEATRALYAKLGRKYWYTPEAGAAASARCAEILQRLARRLERQRAAGSRYFIGHALTALDLYWACHAVTVKPLPHALCPMPELFREVYTAVDPVVCAAAAPILFEHRDYIYEKYLRLPVEF